MGKKKGGFCSAKEAERRKNVSIEMTRRWQMRRAMSDHTYTPGYSNDLPDIAHVNNEVVLDGGDPTSHVDSAWAEGRRVVELGVIAEGLSACKKCGVPLQLGHAMSIRTYGLAAILKIPCSNTNCLFVNNVPTGKRHGEPSRTWDVNSKLANALTHAGVGLSQINNILAALNIPCVHHRLVDVRQEEMGKAVEAVAKEAVQQSLEEECKLTEESTGQQGLSVSVDAGWQKRGSGKAYDSLSGHATMIGARTGKVLGYSVRSKTCRVCSSAVRNKVKSKPHDCRLNWTGSSKAMEQDMVVEMFQQNREEGVKIQTIIGDDDSTTISRLRAEVDPDIEKRSDRNHIKKNLANQLFALQKSHKSLSTKVIKYIQKCWNYMIAQNVKCPEGISIGLTAMWKHPFGDHSSCGEWCEHIRNPSSKFRSLPYGKCLTDLALQGSLAALFEKYQSHTQKLADLGSTQANESLNMTIASKAPKKYHFSGSASLNYRVAAGVAQKNIGHSYVSKVNARAGLSPGVHTMKLALIRDLQHRKRKAIAVTRTAKRKRVELKARKFQSNACLETREGPTYSPEIAIQVDMSNTDEIPPPRPKPSQHAVDFSPETHIAVYFDLETTGLARSSHITQIAAVAGDDKFGCFVIPKVPITAEASRITGITFRNGKMYHRNKEVDGKSITAAIDSFLTFLGKFQKKVFIVGHNIQSFDCHVLMYALHACDKLLKFTEVVDGFQDSMKLFKLLKPGMLSYKQESLCETLANLKYDAHDAVGDVVALQTLIENQKVNFQSEEARPSSFTLQDALMYFEHSKEIRANLPSLQPLIYQKVISMCMARKIAGSGLKYAHLELAFKRNPSDGIQNLFHESNGHSVRVTKSKKIIEKVTAFFNKLSET